MALLFSKAYSMSATLNRNLRKGCHPVIEVKAEASDLFEPGESFRLISSSPSVNSERSLASLSTRADSLSGNRPTAVSSPAFPPRASVF